jgi:hypothetical protein
MATTTTNFGWDIPQSTDLVKDGATAIAALGQDIDTALVDLKGGTTGQVLSKASNTDLDFTWVTDAAGDITGVTAGTGISGGGTSGTVTVTNSMATAIDAKGDLIAGTAADTFARLAIGTDGQILTADAAESTGMKWAAPASGGGLTLISTTALSGSTVTMSTISSAYKNLRLIIKDVYATVNDDIQIRFNSDTGSNYSYSRVRNIGTTLAGGNGVGGTFIPVTAAITTNNTALEKGFADVSILRYTDTDQQEIISTSYCYQGSLPTYYSVSGVYNKSAAITSITLFMGSGNYSGGTAYLYGES